ncbi:unnamed protein product [Amoebophrya sp. A120]|nr:unnamed protein product [Amoebophrya sp. A120]|eukprot:GSA120T00017489001.1
MSVPYEALTIERLCSSPSLTGTSPSGLKISPDGQAITYLKGREDNKNFKDLWMQRLGVEKSDPFLLVSGDPLDAPEESLSNEEKARRERLRVGDARGILQYFWSEDGRSVLCPASDGTRMYLYDVAARKGRMVSVDGTTTKNSDEESAASAVTDAKLSPKGTFLSYVRGQNLFVRHIETEVETQLTFDSSEWIKNGMAEFVAQEEMHRMTGYWWAPDEKYLAFTRVDESPVELVPRNEIYADGVKMFSQRYPYAGRPNALVELCVVRIVPEETDSTEPGPPARVWVPLRPLGATSSKGAVASKAAWSGEAPAKAGPQDELSGDKETLLRRNVDPVLDYYLPRVKWLPAGGNHKGEQSRLLSFQYQSRDQKRLQLRVARIDEEHFSGSSSGTGTLTNASNPSVDRDEQRLQKTTRNYLPDADVRPVLHEENLAAYVNLFEDEELHFFQDGSSRFLWCSEAGTGFKTIYVGKLEFAKLFEADAGEKDFPLRPVLNTKAGCTGVVETNTLSCAASLTPLNHVVQPASDVQTKQVQVGIDALEHVDERQGYVYYTARTNHPATERHLFRLHLQTHKVEQLTSEPGWHSPVFGGAPATGQEVREATSVFFFDHFSSLAQPPQCSLWEVAPSNNKRDKALSPRESCCSRRQWIAENKVADLLLKPYFPGLVTKPFFGSFSAMDDPNSTLYYRVFFPPTVNPLDRKWRPKMPVVCFVYGGPHVQLCITGSRWSDQHLFLQFLLQQNYIVFTVDNRGSSGRGLSFESSVYRDMGKREILDQIAGVRTLCEKYPHLVDPDRIAIYGHSYGGYMALHCLFRSYYVMSDTSNKSPTADQNLPRNWNFYASEAGGEQGAGGGANGRASANGAHIGQKSRADVGSYTYEEAQDVDAASKAVFANRRPLFKCAVSGAPVTTWRLYDTHYTERYMGVPDFTKDYPGSEGTNFTNEAGYESSSVVPYAKFYDDKRSKLLIYHGMADDNVLFQNSTKLYGELFQQKKLFRMCDYPGAKHSMNGEHIKKHLYEMIFDFLQKEL